MPDLPIRTVPPDSPRPFYLVMRLYQSVSARLEDCLREVGITPSQYTALSMLARHEPVSSAELARRVGITAQSMGQCLQALETKGLIRREASLDHGRVMNIQRTPRGRQLLQRCDQLVDQEEAAFFATLSGAELRTFKSTAARLRAQARPSPPDDPA